MTTGVDSGLHAVWDATSGLLLEGPEDLGEPDPSGR